MRKSNISIPDRHSPRYAMKFVLVVAAAAVPLIMVDGFNNINNNNMNIPGKIIPNQHNNNLPFIKNAKKMSARSSSSTDADLRTSSKECSNDDQLVSLFNDFVEFLKEQQKAIIAEIENGIEKSSGSKFSRDCWGIFETDAETGTTATVRSGGITRVIQGGDVIEKGACSFTLIQDGILTAERASTIQSRQQQSGSDESDSRISAGDVYSAAALSIVFHTRSPLIPTFRSDVRIFMVQTKQRNSDDTNPKNNTTKTMAWFGGGADLTPYYLDRDNIQSFHRLYQKLCNDHASALPSGYTYQDMKKECDHYFYLPARQEHRGTGGIFFDDMIANPQTYQFVTNVVQTWMPSWIPSIVQKHMNQPYTQQQKEWQLLRRGRYLEFNLLYDVRVFDCLLLLLLVSSYSISRCIHFCAHRLSMIAENLKNLILFVGSCFYSSFVCFTFINSNFSLQQQRNQ